MKSLAGRLKLDPAAMAQAAANLRAMTADYEQWAERDVIQCIERVRLLQRQPNISAVEIKSLFEIHHNIKGHGGTFDYHLVTQIAEMCCKVLRERETIGPLALLAVEQASLALKIVLQRKLRGEGGPGATALVSRVRAICTPHFIDVD